MKFHELVKKEGRSVEFSEGSHIFKQGDEDRFLYFVQSGLLKAYYLSEDGKVFIKSFILPQDVIGSFLTK